jgi:NADPH-dependent curcumin reductase CurA
VRPCARATYAICEVVDSADPSVLKVDIEMAKTCWADYSTLSARKVSKLFSDGAFSGPLSHFLSAYGIAGKTAYHGLIGVGQAKAGDTVVVSAAAGSVGDLVGQIAKALGCHVVGIAGGVDKCAWVTNTLGFDHCVDYRADGLFKAIKRACPAGVDLYFDNVGGCVLETTLAVMNPRGRVVCCGAISQYDGSAPQGPRNLPGVLVVKRLRMEGFIVMDHAAQDGVALRALRGWVESGQIRVVEDIIDGLENAPAALTGLLAGQNRGKRMVRVAPDPILPKAS